MNPLIVLFGTFVGMLVLRVPIAFALSLSSMFTVLYAGIPLSVCVQRMYSGLNSFPLLAVPLFLLAGSIMGQGGITDRLLDISRVVVGRVRGALAHINVVVSMIFAGLTGSSVADTASIGGILIPAMIREGYSKGFSVAITAASSTIGIIIPPSIFMVVYGGFADVSVAAMFLGGAIPGVLVGFGQMAYTALVARKYDFPGGQKYSFKETASAVARGLPALTIPILIIGGIVGGVFTPTEAAGIATVWSAVLALFIYRVVRTRDLGSILYQSIQQLGPTLFCVAGATAFAWVMAYFQVPKVVEQWARNLSMGPTEALLLVATLYLILGTFMSGVAAIITFMPVVQALGMASGVNPIHLGVIVCMTLALGLVTPPYGLCLLLAAQLGKISVAEAFKSTLIFIALFLVALLACIVFPDTVLLLPRLIMSNFV